MESGKGGWATGADSGCFVSYYELTPGCTNLCEMRMQKQEVYLKDIDEKKRQLREVVGDSYRYDST